MCLCRLWGGGGRVANSSVHLLLVFTILAPRPSSVPIEFTCTVACVYDLRPVHTTHALDAHPIRILSVHIGCALKSVHISNRTNELNRYMMKRVHIVPRAFTPAFHRFTMETIKLSVFLQWCLFGCAYAIAIIGDLKGSDRSCQGDHRTGKGSQSAPWFPRQSNLHPFHCNFRLWQHTLTMHFDNPPLHYLHVTTLPPCYHTTLKAYPSRDFCIFAMNNNMIQFECSTNPPLELDWLRCASERMRIRCEHAKPNSMRIKSGFKC